MRKKVIIIGAGLSGLCTGSYLQINGYDTEIFELHSLPGGLCTSWKRKGYTIDGCIHWLVGSGPANDFNQLWNELINMKKIKFVDPQEFFTVEDRDGRKIHFYSDVNKLEKELLKKAPEDKKLILAFIKAVRKLSRFVVPVLKAPQLMGFSDGMKMMARIIPYIGTFKKWGSISGRQLSEKCRNPLLKKAFLSMFEPDMSALFLAFTLSWMNNKSAGYPIGGSQHFSSLIEKKYLDLGGMIHYRKRVKKIVVKNDHGKEKAGGIVLEDGTTYNADIVVSAADGYSTIFNMLGGRYINKEIQNYYSGFKPFTSYLQVSLGIRRKFEKEPHSLVFPLSKRLRIDRSTSCSDLHVRIFNFDNTAAPKGSTLLTFMICTKDYEYWVKLKKNNIKQYKKEKDRIANEVIDALEERFKNIRSKVNMKDVSTPATVIRYTDNWKGSYEGWIQTPEVGLRQMKKTLPGLDDFYMAGHWVEPGGGVPSTILSGRNLVQIICKQDKKTFGSS
ncbi:MAG: NAD(P)/FAD-dependent oxidoreductase [Spirochaetes bacterium]|nr:NAD(P)/FAD-dependent oxidoreductase [Spirochaetota bacterium]